MLWFVRACKHTHTHIIVCVHIYSYIQDMYSASINDGAYLALYLPSHFNQLETEQISIYSLSSLSSLSQFKGKQYNRMVRPIR